MKAFLDRGHSVRALVRQWAKVEQNKWPSGVEIFRADLRVHPELSAAFQGIDVLVHLAAVVIGDDASHFTSTIGGTERLLEAMSRSKTRRVVLASSLSVYGWLESSRTMDENTPPPRNLYESGAYTIAKIWQERITRRMSTAHGWDLTVLRPGVMWGPGHESVAIAGPSLKSVYFVVGPHRRLPLTYVDNCADAFVKVAEDARAVGETFNVVDGDKVSAWRYAGEILRRTGVRAYRIPLPYWIGLVNARLADTCRRIIFKGRGKLPGLLRPRQFAYLRPLRFSNRKLREKLKWQPLFDFQTALERCFRPKDEPPFTNGQAHSRSER